jgi:hypothetical protein
VLLTRLWWPAHAKYAVLDGKDHFAHLGYEARGQAPEAKGSTGHAFAERALRHQFQFEDFGSVDPEKHAESPERGQKRITLPTRPDLMSRANP